MKKTYKETQFRSQNATRGVEDKMVGTDKSILSKIIILKKNGKTIYTKEEQDSGKKN